MTQFLLLLGALSATAIASAIPEHRLVGADVATYGEFPWMISIRVAASSSHNCGGSLVTPKHVVTAAHCVANSVPIPILPGTIFIVSGHLSNLAGGRVSGVEEVRVHPQYSPSATWRNDIAVLKLLAPIPFSATEQPIPIASADVGVQPCVASGWGRTIHPGSSLPSQLQTQILNTMTWDTCTQFWSSSMIYNSTLCVGAVRGSGVCGGDSGGPLICNGELAGVTSWGNPCGNGMPDGFTRVFHYRDWILANIADVSPLGRTFQAEAAKAATASLQ